MIGRSAIIAVDLGSCFTRLARPGDGPVAEGPSVVAGKPVGRRQRFRPLAAGHRAVELLRYAPEGWLARRPVRHGLVTDPALAAYLLRVLLAEAGLRWRVRQPVAVTAAGEAAGPAAGRLLAEALRAAGFGAVYLVPLTLAAALGSPFPASEASGAAVVHVGAAGTEVGIVSSGMAQHIACVAIGGEAYTEAVAAAAAEEVGLRISLAEADRIKATLGMLPPDGHVALVGMDSGTGLPATRTVDVQRLLERIRPLNEQLGRSVRAALRGLSAELAADVCQNGILLTGGGAAVPGLRDAIAEQTGLAARLAERPDHAVIRGLSLCARDVDLWNRRLSVEQAA